MTGLVEEIQAKVLDRSFPTADLLRMVKLAAAKLGLSETIEWVDNELRGYPDDAALPEYRKVEGQLKCHNPLRGAIPVFGDANVIRQLGERQIAQSISDIEELASNASGEAWGKLPAETIDQINRMNGGIPMDYYVHIPSMVFQNMIQQVRNLILEWVIGLEQQGILGSGVSFSMEEKKKAEEAAQSITINNYGHFHQGNTNGDQNKTVIGSTDNSVNTITTKNVFDQAIHAINSNIANQNDREELVSLVEAMKGAQGTEEYKPLFQKWVGYLADYATVLGPFLPALSQLTV